MHRFQGYLDNIGFLASPVHARALTAGEAHIARGHGREDASALLYSAAVSIADALRGLHRGFFTWATVKLYYSVFYSARAALIFDDIALVYRGTKPFTLRVRPGETLKKEKGTTHEVILLEFARSAPNSFYLSQTIGLEQPLDWLRQRREEANYKEPRASEPKAPPHFQRLYASGIRRTTLAYLAKGGDAHVFDPDHAMLSFPLLFWRDTLAAARAAGLTDIVSSEAEFLNEAFRDDAGPLPDLYRLVVG